jgi:hypothetical protein
MHFDMYTDRSGGSTRTSGARRMNDNPSVRKMPTGIFCHFVGGGHLYI